MAARVRRVVMAIPVLPGMDSGGRKRESQETITKSPGKYGDLRGIEGLETRKFERRKLALSLLLFKFKIYKLLFTLSAAQRKSLVCIYKRNIHSALMSVRWLQIKTFPLYCIIIKLFLTD